MKVKPKFTLLEAEQAVWAMSNMIECTDRKEREDFFEGKRNANAAERAMEKMREALDKYRKEVK